MPKAPKRVLVCGGRTYGYKFTEDGSKIIDEQAVEKVFKILDFMLERAGYLTVISGAADGADTWAIKWVESVIQEYPDNVDIEVYPANWERYGKSAGFIRNKQMLDEGQPDVVVAFEGGKGTEMMKDIARKAGVKVFEVGNSNNENQSRDSE